MIDGRVAHVENLLVLLIPTLKTSATLVFQHPIMIRSFAKTFALLAGSFFVAASFAWADENWPSFRGPNNQGHADSANLPTKWSEKENVAWKIKLPGKGHSTPVIRGDRLWLTTATEDGKELSVLCIDKNTGEILIDKVLHKVEKPQTLHPVNSYASCTPIIEEGRIYVSFGSPYLGCLDAKTGDVLWERTDIGCNHLVGPRLFADPLQESAHLALRRHRRPIRRRIR